MRKYLTPNGLVDAAAYVRYLRGAAARWRDAPVFGTGMERKRQKAENEEEARRVEAKADAIEKGEE